MARLLGFGLALTVVTLSAQSVERRATNVAALLAQPGFYHLHQVVLIGTTTLAGNGDLRVDDDAGSLKVVFKGGRPEGTNELRGEFWDLGRMNPDDPRLASYDLKGTFEIDPEGAWPQPGKALALIASSIQS